MAKTMYIGIGGVARKVKQPFVGIGGVARKVKNGFIGVGGVARGCYQGVTYLYNSGDECTSLTGGWQFPTIQTASNLGANPVFDTNVSGGHTMTRTKNTNNINLKITASSNLQLGVISMYCKNSIAFDGYKKLCMELDYSMKGSTSYASSAQAYMNFAVWSVAPSGTKVYNTSLAKIGITGHNNTSSVNTSANGYTLELDVSTVSGNGWVNFYSLIYEMNSGFVSNAVIKKVWLE